MTVTEQLREAIAEASSEGTTRYQIAKLAEVDYSTLHRFAEGTRPYLRSDSIDRLAEYFGLELAPKRRRKKAETATKQPRKKARKKA